MLEKIKKLFSSKSELQICRDETFDYEDNQEHFVGSHFDAFYDDMEQDIMMKIPEFIEDAKAIKPYENIMIKDEPKNDIKWLDGYITISPKKEQDDYIGVVFGKVPSEDNVQLISMFPCLAYGSEYTLSLEKVFVWSNGHEAQIEVDLGFTTINFYDTNYTLNRKWYLKDNKYTFQIMGIAYRCEPRVEKEIEVDPKPEVAEALGLSENTKKRTISLEGMSSFIPISDWDRDDYSFSGIIQEIYEVYINMLNEKVWICSTRVLRSGGDTDDELIYDIDILVTSKTWKGNNIPQKGDDIEGSVWMQGKLKEVYTAFDEALDNLTTH